MSRHNAEQNGVSGVYGSMSCACAIAAYLGLNLMLLEGIPQTIHFERVDWESAYPTETQLTSGVRANSADGSQATSMQVTTRTLHLFTKEKRAGRSIYTRNPHTSYLVDDARHSVV